mgnify:CR=1 FL=1
MFVQRYKKMAKVCLLSTKIIIFAGNFNKHTSDMKQMIVHFWLLSAALLLSYTTIQAQQLEPNLKWGKPTQEELTMTAYAPDKEADAVELFKSVSVNYDIINGNFRVFHRVKCRLKVLKPEGKRVADVSISYRENETNRIEREAVLGLKATAYNYDNGKLTKTKMESSMVNTERIDKTYKRLKFSVPQVRVGTVIEYEYRIESDFYFTLRDWYAQTDIPVAYTQYELSVPEWLSFNIEERGMESLEKKQDTGRLTVGDENVATNETTFIGRHLPALKGDDYVWAAEDYGNKVTHELKGVYIPGAVYKDFTSKWEDIDKALLDDDEFGGRLKKSSPLKADILAAGIPDLADKRERAAAVYQLLKQRVRWNGDYKLWAKSGTKVLKEGTGSNADLNFLYMNMLHDAGLQAVPVLLRLRDYGRLPLTHASMKYLSTFVVGIEDTDSTLTYIDGSVEDGYMDVLPTRLLVERARVVQKGKPGYWVNLLSTARGKDVTVVQAALTADGLLKGQKTSNLTEEAAALLRREWRTAKDSLDMIQQMQERDGIEIQHYQLKGQHDFSPAASEIINFTKQCDTAGDMIYLNPLVVLPIRNNPFTAEARRLPVEFPYCQSEMQNVVITLPQGYQVEELPKPIVLRLDGITARILYQLTEGGLNVQYRMNIERTFFDQSQYSDLKDLFDKLTENVKHIITIKKTT